MKPPKEDSPIIGYVGAYDRIMAADKHERFTGWFIGEVVKRYRLDSHVSDEGEAVVLILDSSAVGGQRPYYGAGYSLGSSMLFRGEVVGYNRAEAKVQAVIEAEYWMERDATDEAEEEFENDDERE